MAWGAFDHKVVHETDKFVVCVTPGIMNLDEPFFWFMPISNLNYDYYKDFKNRFKQLNHI